MHSAPQRLEESFTKSTGLHALILGEKKPSLKSGLASLLKALQYLHRPFVSGGWPGEHYAVLSVPRVVLAHLWHEGAGSAQHSSPGAAGAPSLPYTPRSRTESKAHQRSGGEHVFGNSKASFSSSDSKKKKISFRQILYL